MEEEANLCDRWYLQRLWNSQRKVYLKEGDNRIGRDKEAEVLVPSNFASRRHCVITMREDLIGIEDLSSFNGTFINGQVLKGASCELNLNDVIAIGGPLDAAAAAARPDVHIYRLRNDLKESEWDVETVEYNNGEHIEEMECIDEMECIEENPQEEPALPDSVLGSEDEAIIVDGVDDDDEHENKFAMRILSQMDDDVQEVHTVDIVDNRQFDEETAISSTPEIIDLISDNEQEDEDLDNADKWLVKLSQGKLKEDVLPQKEIQLKDARVLLTPLKISEVREKVSMEEEDEASEDEIRPVRKGRLSIRLFSSDDSITDNDLSHDEDEDVLEISINQIDVQIMEADQSDAVMGCETPKRKSDDGHDARDEGRTEKRRKHSFDPKPSTSAVTPELLAKKRRNVVRRLEIIDAPPRPKRRAHLRGFCASEMGKSQKKVSLKTIQHQNAVKNVPVEQIIRTKEIKEIRKEKLKEVTLSKGLPESRAVPTPAPTKVKLTSENRGNFLMEILPKRKIPTRRQSFDAAMEALNKLPARIGLRRKSVDVRDESWYKRNEERRKIEEITQQDEAYISQGTHIREKKRIAHNAKSPAVQMSEAKVSLTQMCLPEILQPTRQTKVTFAEMLDVREYSLNPPISPPLPMNMKDILLKVTLWDPQWLTDPDVNIIWHINESHSLKPIQKSFPDFVTYTEIMFPLMLLDLWALLVGEKQIDNSNNMTFGNLVNMIPGKTTSTLAVTVPARYLMVHPGDLVKITGIGNDGGIKADSNNFAYVTNIDTPKFETKIITLEINSKFKLNWRTEKVAIGKVATISSAMRAFDNVINMQNSPLCDQILNPESAKYDDIQKVKNYTYRGHDQLNQSQMAAIEAVYAQCMDPRATVSLIQGPPGTGKSHVISNLIIQLLSEKHPLYPDMKILICAPSNIVVDYMTYKLACIRNSMSTSKRNKYRFIRFGVEEKISKMVKCFSLEEISKNYKKDMIAKRFEAEYQQNWVEKLKILEKRYEESKKIGDYKRAEQSRLKTKINELNNYLNGHDFQKTFIYDRLLENANIILTTLSSCCNLIKYGVGNFNVCIVDEAAQSNEPWTLAPLQFGISSLVLVGDPLQLPATVLSMDAKKHGLSQSLFKRLSMCRNIPVQFLNEQYRMHPEICHFPNKKFYENRLLTHPSTTDPNFPWKPYGVFSLEYSQQNKSKSHCISNTVEVDFVSTLVKVLLQQTNTSDYTYGIITPYSQQRNNLIEKLGPISKDILINTIDGYQGQERDIIIISIARTEGIGFLANSERLNVALTRAKKCLFVCGNFINLKRKDFWNEFIQNAKTRQIFQIVNTVNEDIIQKFVKK
ncbi:hypothetical protein DMENIID0001_162450 [Sergentomyia squamirostris]